MSEQNIPESLASRHCYTHKQGGGEKRDLGRATLNNQRDISQKRRRKKRKLEIYKFESQHWYLWPKTSEKFGLYPKRARDVSSTAFPTGADWDITTAWPWLGISYRAFLPAAVTKQGAVTQFVRILVVVELLRGFNLKVCFSCKKMEISRENNLILITLYPRKIHPIENWWFKNKISLSAMCRVEWFMLFKKSGGERG